MRQNNRGMFLAFSLAFLFCGCPSLVWSDVRTPVVSDWFEFKDNLEERGLSFEAAYTGEFWANTKGGTKRDTTYLGNLDVTLSLDTEQAGLWPGGTFFIYLLDNHGGEKLTGGIVGDTQTVSNIEAPRTTRIYELWYEHLFLDDGLSILLGIHDLNSEFIVTEYGSLYINSSFGIGADVAVGGRPSIFPIAAPAVRAKVVPNESWEILLGVYDGDPDDAEVEEHFPRSDFDSNGGAFFISEVAHHIGQSEESSILPGTYKLGTWYSTGEFSDVVDTDASGTAITRDGNFGVYIVIDQMLYRENGDQGLGAFLQLGVVPDHLNEVDHYIGGGLNYLGLLPSRDEDELGIAVAHASISDELVSSASRDHAETVLEVTYRTQICDNFAIQPDLQFIFNPGGDESLGNAVVVGTRFEISL